MKRVIIAGVGPGSKSCLTDCLLLGMGLGLLTGYMICVTTVPDYFTERNWHMSELGSNIFSERCSLAGVAATTSGRLNPPGMIFPVFLRNFQFYYKSNYQAQTTKKQDICTVNQ